MFEYDAALLDIRPFYLRSLDIPSKDGGNVLQKRR